MNCSRLSTCIHCGTHIDAPFHFFADGRTIEDIPLDVCVGPAVLIHHPQWQAKAPIHVRHLEGHEALIRKARRVILRTGWSLRWDKPGYFTDHPVITAETAQWLVDLAVVLVGVDFPSVDRPPHPGTMSSWATGW